MKITNKTLSFLPVALLLGFGVGIFYLTIIMYCITGCLPDISDILTSLSDLEQIVQVLGG